MIYDIVERCHPIRIAGSPPSILAVCATSLLQLHLYKALAYGQLGPSMLPVFDCAEMV